MIAIALLIDHSGYINGQPFNPSHLHRGFSGLSLGFPLAVYLFVDNAAALTNAHIPFITAAGTVASGLVFIAYIAGFTSICSCLISTTNSQARIIFNSEREGLLHQSPPASPSAARRRGSPSRCISSSLWVSHTCSAGTPIP